MATDTKIKISLPLTEERAVFCPSCHKQKAIVVAGAIKEPCELPAKCECGKEFILTFEVE